MTTRPAGPAVVDVDSVLTLLVDDPAGGGTREVPVRFISIDRRFLLLAPAIPLPRWFATLRSASRARWRVGGRTLVGRVSELEDPAPVRAQFEILFGVDRVARWLGAEIAGLALEADGTRPDAHAEIEDYFDRASADYDRLVEGNPLDRMLRTSSLEILRHAFHPGDTVLEIGAGTGIETLPLAAAGIRVVATDISAGMLERLTSKANATGLERMIEVHHLAAHQLEELERVYEPGSFQGAFSTFGALNCEPAWRGVVPTLARLVAPGGALVLGIWNRVCLVELAGYTIAGRPRRAFARLSSPAPVGLTRFGIPVYPSTVAEYRRAFAPSFQVESILGVPVVLPPYDLMRHMPNPDALVPLLAAVDERIRPWFPFNRMGDHFLMVLRRRAEGAKSPTRLGHNRLRST